MHSRAETQTQDVYCSEERGTNTPTHPNTLRITQEMSGKRMVSSVQITLAPPWRAELSQKKQTHIQSSESVPRRSEPRGPDLRPAPEDSWSGLPDLKNGDKDWTTDLPSFPHTFLDDIPTSEDFLSPDLPPPLPVLLPPSPKRISLDPSPAPLPDTLSLELEKLELAYSPSLQKPVMQPSPSPVKPPSLHSNHHKREDPMPAKQSLNGYNAKPESSEICAFCHKTILPNAAAIEAMKKQYHASCFTCRKCHRLLAGQQYYQKDGQPICDHCYKDTLEKCAKCHTMILQHIVRAMGDGYHPECFRCVVCNRMIADESFAVDEYNDVHCADDYYRKYAPVCSVCEEPIIPQNGQDSYKIECIGRNFHENCYRCERCQVLLSLEPTENGCYPLKGHLFCKSCHLSWSDELS
ncbi:filamin-binding LIM protein 1 isoform X2 [Mixophyes fleayi]|uniref:filamin-binding LIM protein 1 isoform X2 n=1 Tax=Mixophyes fleayi TaxID=3061075 RepID=UPI003F4DB696